MAKSQKKRGGADDNSAPINDPCDKMLNYTYPYIKDRTIVPGTANSTLGIMSKQPLNILQLIEAQKQYPDNCPRLIESLATKGLIPLLAKTKNGYAAIIKCVDPLDTTSVTPYIIKFQHSDVDTDSIYQDAITLKLLESWLTQLKGTGVEKHFMSFGAFSPNMLSRVHNNALDLVPHYTEPLAEGEVLFRQSNPRFTEKAALLTPAASQPMALSAALSHLKRISVESLREFVDSHIVPFMDACLQLGALCGLSHGDMHLGNILFDRQVNRLVLIDFGRAYVDPRPDPVFTSILSRAPNKLYDPDMFNLYGKKFGSWFTKHLPTTLSMINCNIDDQGILTDHTKDVRYTLDRTYTKQFPMWMDIAGFVSTLVYAYWSELDNTKKGADLITPYRGDRTQVLVRNDVYMMYSDNMPTFEKAVWHFAMMLNSLTVPVVIPDGDLIRIHKDQEAANYINMMLHTYGKKVPTHPAHTLFDLEELSSENVYFRSCGVIQPVVMARTFLYMATLNLPIMKPNKTSPVGGGLSLMKTPMMTTSYRNKFASRLTTARATSGPLDKLQILADRTDQAWRDIYLEKEQYDLMTRFPKRIIQATEQVGTGFKPKVRVMLKGQGKGGKGMVARVVHLDKTGKKYIVIDSKNVYLSDMRGKYTYI